MKPDTHSSTKAVVASRRRARAGPLLESLREWLRQTRAVADALQTSALHKLAA